MKSDSHEILHDGWYSHKLKKWLRWWELRDWKWFFCRFSRIFGGKFGVKSENEFSPTFSWRKVPIVVKFLDFGLPILKTPSLLKLVERFSLYMRIRRKKNLFLGGRSPPKQGSKNFKLDFLNSDDPKSSIDEVWRQYLRQLLWYQDWKIWSKKGRTSP